MFSQTLGCVPSFWSFPAPVRSPEKVDRLGELGITLVLGPLKDIDPIEKATFQADVATCDCAIVNFGF
jgi:hypothetical protein